MKLEKKHNILTEILTFIEMCIIPPGFPRFILLFSQMFYEENDSLMSLILAGVMGFGEGWKGCMLWRLKWHQKWDRALYCSWQGHKAGNKRIKDQSVVQEEQEGKGWIADMLGGTHLLLFQYPKGELPIS